MPVLSLTALVAGLDGRVGVDGTTGPGTRLVGVDGPAGSGKTTLATRLATAAGEAGRSVEVVHMDDLYDGWSALVGDRGRDLADRVDTGLLVPLAAHRPGSYRRYDWPSAAFAEEHTVEPVDVLVLEGCGAAGARWADRTALAVWVEVPRALGTARWLARDDDIRAAQQCRDWQADEAAQFAADGTRARADLVVDGAGGQPE